MITHTQTDYIIDAINLWYQKRLPRSLSDSCGIFGENLILAYSPVEKYTGGRVLHFVNINPYNYSMNLDHIILIESWCDLNHVDLIFDQVLKDNVFVTHFEKNNYFEYTDLIVPKIGKCYYRNYDRFINSAKYTFVKMSIPEKQHTNLVEIAFQ